MFFTKRKLFSILIIGFGSFSYTAELVAAGFRLPNQNAFATGRGNAFAATANNASAVYYNPAGIVQLPGTSFELGSAVVTFSVDLDTADQSFSNSDDIFLIPQAFFTQQSGEWNWGVGLYSPFGLGNEWPDDTSFSTITRSAEITYFTLSPVVAREVSPGISLGAGLTINYADANLRQGIGIVPGDEFEYDGSDFAVGYVVSMLAKLGSWNRIGVSYRSKAEHDLSGTASVSFVPEDTSSSLAITVPAILTLGYATQPLDNWEFEVNIEWGDWSQIDQIVITDTSLGGDLAIDFEWEDGFIYQLGATRYFDKSAVSFGYNFNESVQPEEFYTPAVSDADRNWVYVGYTRNNKDSKSWTVAYQYGQSDRTVDERVPNLAGETANGRYRVRSHNLYFSYDIKF